MTLNSDVQRDGSYSQFFMSQSGKKHVVGGKASMDNIILGRDIDNSGEEPHKDYMSRFGTHAGLKSGEKMERPFRKPCYAMTSTMDSVIWGRDFDRSGETPHKMFSCTYSDHAGVQAGDKPNRPFRKGQYAMKSVVDDVVFGRDMDQSGADPHSHFEQKYDEHAGYLANDLPSKPFRQPNCALLASNDEVIYGRDMDFSGPGDPQQNFMGAYPEHAGLKNGEIVKRPYRKYGISQKATADTVIFNRDVDNSGQDPRSEYMQQYAEHAGIVSGPKRAVGKHIDPRDPRYSLGSAKGQQKCACDPRSGESKVPASARSASEKVLSRGWMSSAGSPRMSDKASAPRSPTTSQPASIVPTERKNPFKFDPNSRRSSTTSSAAPSLASSLPQNAAPFAGKAPPKNFASRTTSCCSTSSVGRARSPSTPGSAAAGRPSAPGVEKLRR